MSLVSKITALINAGNETTGDSETNLTAVVQNLIDGYGGGTVMVPVTYNLTNVTSSNTASEVEKRQPYTSTLTPATGLVLDSVIVMMGGNDITSTAYDSGVISISRVTGTLIITATAAAAVDPITISDVDSSFRTVTEAVVAEVNDAPANSVSFIVLTDTHGSSNGQKSQNVCRYILKNSRANKLFWLGDISAVNWSLSEYETFAAPLLNCADKVYPTLGNHEYMGNANGTGLSDIYDDFLADKTLNGSPANFYYYFDDASKKVRYIVINTSDGGTDKVGNAQLTWLSSAVTVPTAEWGLVIFSHYPFDERAGSSGGVQLYSSYGDEIQAILETTNGVLLSHFCGHVHDDNTTILEPLIYEQRLEADVETGQAISIITVDLTAKTVDIKRIGVGTDISYEYDDFEDVTFYTITNNLTHTTNSNSKSRTMSGYSYTATLTADTNYDLTGAVTITMGGVDITATAYTAATQSITISSVTGNITITANPAYVEPITEYTAAWLVKDTSTTKPKFTFTSNATAAAGWPDYLAFIMCNQSTAWPTGYRNASMAYYQSRTSGWTNSKHYMKGGTETNNLPSAITSVTVNGKNYCYITITKADSDAAYALYEAALSGGQFDNGNLITMLPQKTLDASFEYWVIAQNVTADNIESIIQRLPAHT